MIQRAYVFFLSQEALCVLLYSRVSVHIKSLTCLVSLIQVDFSHQGVERTKYCHQHSSYVINPTSSLNLCILKCQCFLHAFNFHDSFLRPVQLNNQKLELRKLCILAPQKHFYKEKKQVLVFGFQFLVGWFSETSCHYIVLADLVLAMQPRMVLNL